MSVTRQETRRHYFPHDGKTHLQSSVEKNFNVKQASKSVNLQKIQQIKEYFKLNIGMQSKNPNYGSYEINYNQKFKKKKRDVGGSYSLKETLKSYRQQQTMDLTWIAIQKKLYKKV